MLGEPMCSGRRCVVVGSALGVELPKAMPNDILIGANGGAAIALAAGRSVDVLVTTAHLFAQSTKLDKATCESLRGLEVYSIWVDTKNGTLLDTQVALSSKEIRASTYAGVDPFLRDKVMRQAVGFAAWVSTGVWAACLAVASHASSVVLAGFSMREGHAGMLWDQQPRHHVQEDARCLRALGPLGVEMPIELVEAVI